MAKAKNGEKNGQSKVKTVSVPADLVAKHPWLEQIKSNRRTAGEVAERAKRAGSKVDEPVTEIVRDYVELRGREDDLKNSIATRVENLRDLWARGLTKADGVSISPALELRLPYGAFTAELDAETAAKVIRHEPVLDVAELIRLADNDPKLQAAIERHILSNFSVEVQRVTTMPEPAAVQ